MIESYLQISSIPYTLCIKIIVSISHTMSKYWKFFITHRYLSYLHEENLKLIVVINYVQLYY